MVTNSSPRSRRRERHRERRLDDGAAVIAGKDYPACRGLVDRYVVRHRNYYRRRADLVRRFFRYAGVMVIVCSGALPVTAFVEGNGARLLTIILSVAVAGLTALRAFYQWDVQWRLLRQADWELTYLIATWEADIRELACKTGSESDCEAVTLTRQLLRDAEKVVEAEASSFFRGLGWPATNTADDETQKDKRTGGDASKRKTPVQHAGSADTPIPPTTDDESGAPPSAPDPTPTGD